LYPTRARRSARAGRLGLLIGALLAAAPARAWDVADLFTPRSPLELPAAAALLERAREKLLGGDGEQRIRITRKTRAGDVERQSFVVRRQVVAGSRRVVTEEIGGGQSAGRVLQIEQAGGEVEAWAFLRATRAAPFPTSFRLADPFLCTWYDSATAETSPGTTQIVARRPGAIQGERVQWLTVQPGELRRFHHSELAIAERDSAILEYRHFEREGDVAPALIVRLPRSRMVELGEHVLPGLVLYGDPERGETIRVDIEHAPLAPDLGPEAFSPESFHLAPIERASSGVLAP